MTQGGSLADLKNTARAMIRLGDVDGVQAAGTVQLAILDVSGSMDERDAEGNIRRIDALRRVIKDLVQEFHSMQMLAFSSGGYMDPRQRPKAARMVTGPIPEPSGGTDMIQALRSARDFIDKHDKKNVTVLFISDGGPTEPADYDGYNGDPEKDTLAEARKWAQDGYPELNCIYAGPARGSGARFMRQLAKAGGGEFEAKSFGNIAGLLQTSRDMFMLAAPSGSGAIQL